MEVVSEMEFCDDCNRETSWVEEDLGANSLKVCSECGKSKENFAYEANCDEQTASGQGSQLVHDDEEINFNNKIFTPRTSQKHKQLHFIRCIKDIASRMNLSKSSTDRCVSCGKIILKKNYDLSRKTIRIAAAVVFLDLKSVTPSLLMKDFSKQIGMKLTLFSNEVSKLKREFGEMFVLEAKPEECLQGVVDELCQKMDVSQDKRSEVLKWTSQLRELTTDCAYKGNRLTDMSKLNLSAYFALALQFVDPSFCEIREKIEAITGFTVNSIAHKMYVVRKKLLALAKTLPSADHYQFTLDNITNYLPSIIRNKTFLLKGSEKFHALDGPSSSAAVEPERCVNVPYVADWQEDEEDSALSELDDGLEQYIATDLEVKEKVAISKMVLDSSSEKASRRKKTKAKPGH